MFYGTFGSVRIPFFFFDFISLSLITLLKRAFGRFRMELEIFLFFCDWMSEFISYFVIIVPTNNKPTKPKTESEIVMK